ncbi:MAG TPA: hypothetical protein VHV53_07695, partial [Solirubrobacterales bacterium]|nr:hypothetical protein [Solirubrobacterales bacterium]
LVGALSGVVVIAIAIAAFVVLVSAQVFHDLPIPALSSSDQKAAVSTAKAVSPPDHQAVATTGGVTTGVAQPTGTGPNGAGPNGPTGAAAPQEGRRHGGNSAPTEDATAPAEVAEGTAGTTGGNEASSTGGNPRSHSSQPTTSSNPPSSTSAPNSSSGGGNGTTGTSGSGGSGNSTSGSTGSPGGGAATGTSGGGSTTSPPSTPVTTAKPSEELTEGLNGTVGGVDEATGGGLHELGVTHVTEEVVNGAAGPESVVGKTVDGVGEVVGGLLGGNGE